MWNGQDDYVDVSVRVVGVRVFKRAFTEEEIRDIYLKEKEGSFDYLNHDDFVCEMTPRYIILKNGDEIHVVGGGEYE